MAHDYLSIPALFFYVGMYRWSIGCMQNLKFGGFQKLHSGYLDGWINVESEVHFFMIFNLVRAITQIVHKFLVNKIMFKNWWGSGTNGEKCMDQNIVFQFPILDYKLSGHEFRLNFIHTLLAIRSSPVMSRDSLFQDQIWFLL